MRFAQKKPAVVKAYCLGCGSAVEEQLIKEGKILKHSEDGYELFSQEAKSGEGEKAKKGDFFKVDGSGYPYPIRPESFRANHAHISGDDYVQIPKPRAVWEWGDDIFPEVQYLLDTRQLKLDEESREAFFQAHLEGAFLTSSRDSVLVFYSMEKDEEGKMSFNFVAREEFDATYDYIENVEEEIRKGK